MYAVSYAWRDKTSDADGGWEWSFPEDHPHAWQVACEKALQSALSAWWPGATLTVTGGITPHEGCLDDDDQPIPGSVCGEPAERKFRVLVEDEDCAHLFTVT